MNSPQYSQQNTEVACCGEKKKNKIPARSALPLSPHPLKRIPTASTVVGTVEMGQPCSRSSFQQVVPMAIVCDSEDGGAERSVPTVPGDVDIVMLGTANAAQSSHCVDANSSTHESIWL